MMTRRRRRDSAWPLVRYTLTVLALLTIAVWTLIELAPE